MRDINNPLSKEYVLAPPLETAARAFPGSHLANSGIVVPRIFSKTMNHNNEIDIALIGDFNSRPSDIPKIPYPIVAKSIFPYVLAKEDRAFVDSHKRVSACANPDSAKERRILKAATKVINIKVKRAIAINLPAKSFSRDGCLTSKFRSVPYEYSFALCEANTVSAIKLRKSPMVEKVKKAPSNLLNVSALFLPFKKTTVVIPADKKSEFRRVQKPIQAGAFCVAQF